MTSLVLFSSGPDSTWLLKQLLEFTDEPIVAYFMTLPRHNAAGYIERNRARKIHRYLQTTYRPFEYVEGNILTGTSIPILYSGFLAAMITDYILARGDIDVIYMGCCEEETDPRSVLYTPGGLQMFKQTVEFLFNHPDTQEAWDANYYKPGAKLPRFERPAETIPKAQILEDLGWELLNLTWSCGNPVKTGRGQYQQCGKCNKCKVRDNAYAEILPSSGW